MNALKSQAGPYRVLIVDDEEIVLVALRETLLRAGYQVSTAPDPLSALEMLQFQQFAVIISDQQMPAMTGLDFLTKAKQMQPDASRMLITAVLSLDTVIEAINRGEIYRFIIKPWLREELLVTVQNAVQRFDLLCKNTLLQAATQAMNEKLTQLNRELELQVARVAEQNDQLSSLNEALERNLSRSVELCVQAAQTFYPTLGNQARRAFEVCRSMAEVLNLSADQKQQLEISAWLHDIGLIGIPRHLIRKWQTEPNELDDAERALIEHHTVLGQELAGFVHHLEGIGQLIRSHHERFDGLGYPDKLSGQSIPWLARLLAVAVAFAESQFDQENAVQSVRLSSGTAFDPEAVRVFIRAIPKAAVPRKEKEVMLSELAPGMVLAKGIYTPNGLLLIPEGQQLSAPYIDKLLNHNRITPINQSLVVYC
ncbi:MAG TPA: HD domain-containing phosphohydrolase [Verrucomicrobiae bacterium]|nr:HD domain-containing phosphohydrolase [Verrucomicrobiae bacterium]